MTFASISLEVSSLIRARSRLMIRGFLLAFIAVRTKS
jgi:hypothetical protein